TTVIAPDGSTATDSDSTVDGNALVYSLRDDLPTGTFLVSYRVVSADGHPVPGGFTFSIGQTSAPPADTPTDTDTDPTVSGLVAVDRYLGYAGLALVLGPGLLLIAGDPGSRRGAMRLIAVGLSTVAGTAVIGLYLQVPYTAGSGLFDVTGEDVGAVLDSRFGGAAMIRLLVVLTALPLLRQLATSRPGKPLRAGLAGLAVVLCGTWPFSGHATTSPAPVVTILSDTIHIGVVGLWLGGLVTLVGYLLRPAKTAAAVEFLPTWSRWAGWLVTALAVAGTASAVVQIGSPDVILASNYGRLVLVKVVLFGALLAVAAAARRTVGRSAAMAGATPEPTADPAMESGPDVGRAGESVVSGLRRRIITELTIAVVIVGVSTVLIHESPAWTQQPTGVETQKEYDSVELAGRLYTLQFDLEPAKVGVNTAHLYLFDPEGRPLEPVEWHAALGQSGNGIAPVEHQLEVLSPNHVSGDVTIPSSGDWDFTFRIRTSEIDEETVATVVTVK
ncbi:MAG: copper resistance CopC/CopD family protein, partial [Stackebrandtia sp.]